MCMLALLAKKKKKYNSRDSLVITHPTTNRPLCITLTLQEKLLLPVLTSPSKYCPFHPKSLVY